MQPLKSYKFFKKLKKQIPPMDGRYLFLALKIENLKVEAQENEQRLYKNDGRNAHHEADVLGLVADE